MTPSPGSVTLPTCPLCSSELQLGSHGDLDHWSCPKGHGLAMTLSETYGRLQDDEIDLLWQTARTAAAGPLTSPFTGRPMVRFALAYDSDEAPEGTEGDGPDEGTVEVDVDLDNQFIWFDVGELDELPHDIENAPPSQQELDAAADIRAKFSADIEAALDERDDREISERMYQRIARNPKMVRSLDRLGRAVTTY